MRNVVMVAVVLMLLAGTAMAAQPGQVPSATLAQMGLGQMHQMSDVQGRSIRGSGFAQVGGTSQALAASFLGSSSSGPNTYTATSSTVAGSFALSAGATVAAAGGGFFFQPPNGGAPIAAVGGTFAFGGSIAFAK